VESEPRHHHVASALLQLPIVATASAMLLLVVSGSSAPHGRARSTAACLCHYLSSPQPA
jgi:hypothetical protein